MKLLAIDGNSLINRAFYGIKLLTTKDGQYTNAVYGFINILHRLEELEAPDGVAVAFDLKAPTFRHKMYTNYKAGRKGMPEELRSQMPILKEWLTLAGYTFVSKTVTSVLFQPVTAIPCSLYPTQQGYFLPLQKWASLKL